MTHRRGLCASLFIPALAFVLAALVSTAEAQDKAGGERPNILFIFTDDHAAHAIGAYQDVLEYGVDLEGHTPTPNLDKLAEQGMLFENAFVTNSICKPSRAVILTGKYGHLNGMPANGGSFDGSQPTFPKMLQKAGYQTALIGKWHLRSTPTGFDHYEIHYGQGQYYNPPFKTPDGRLETTGYTVDVTADRTLNWLKNSRDRGKPFMLMFQPKAPHRNWMPGPKYLDQYAGQDLPEPDTLFYDYSGLTEAATQQEMEIDTHARWGWDLKVPRNPETGEPADGYERMMKMMTPEQRERWHAAYRPRNEELYEKYGEELTGKDLARWQYQRYIKDYLRSTASVDENIGRVLDYLEKSGLAENTIVIYNSDQGFFLGENGWFDKRWIYEESLRAPLIVRWPDAVEPGSINDDMVLNLDLPETFLDIAGVEVPDDMQGRSLVPVLKGETPGDWRDSMYYHYYEFPAVHMVARHTGVRTERYKLIHFYQNDDWELFDLKKDPKETQSVYGDPEYADVQKRLKQELDRLQRKYEDNHPHEPISAIRQRLARERIANMETQRVLQMDRPRKVDQKPDCAMKPITVGATIVPEKDNGVIIAQGGASVGYTLHLNEGVPTFAVRSGGNLKAVSGKLQVPMNEPSHVIGVLDKDSELHIYVNGEAVGTAEGHFISHVPNNGLAMGADPSSPVGDYKTPNAFEGEIRDIRLYWGVPDEQTLKQWTQR